MPKITLDDMIAEAQRELRVRRRVYPRWMRDKWVDPVAAPHRIACMAAIMENLQAQVQVDGQGEMFVSIALPYPD